MGQAKQRGSKQDRIQAAQAKQREQLGIFEKPIEEVYKEYNLPETAVPIGYVINITESDEFLALYEEVDDRTNYAYTPRPELAKIFEDVNDAIPVAKNVAEKYETDICFMFDTDSQYMVFPITTIKN